MPQNKIIEYTREMTCFVDILGGMSDYSPKYRMYMVFIDFRHSFGKLLSKFLTISYTTEILETWGREIYFLRVPKYRFSRKDVLNRLEFHQTKFL